ncbi:MAG: hypothetical protein HOW73_43890 [Polyangiaceae bacterium]|nr:hypothetical protein [Polyangiaceae bacterium]
MSYQANDNPAPASSATPAGGTEGLKPVANEPETTSGEALLVSAYAVLWVALMVFIVLAWRRTRGLEDKVGTLERAIERARASGVGGEANATKR